MKHKWMKKTSEIVFSLLTVISCTLNASVNALAEEQETMAVETTAYTAEALEYEQYSEEPAAVQSNARMASASLMASAAPEMMDSGFYSIPKMSYDELLNLYDSIGQYTSLYQTQPVLSNGVYTPSVLTDAAYQSALDWINYYRTCAGLTEVSFTDAANESAAYGALVDAAYGELSHYPSKPADMDQTTYEKGYDATTSSNLSYAGGYSASGIIRLAVSGQMEDEDAYNVQTLGHRRWLINPCMKTSGIGVAHVSGSMYGTEYFTDIKTFNNYVTLVSNPTSSYRFIAWPASGNNLADTFPAGTPWSVTLSSALYRAPSASSVQVTVTQLSDGQTLTFNSSTAGSGNARDNYFAVNNSGYGVNNCIIFRPGSNYFSSYDGDYTVRITGLQDASGNSAELNYTVSFASSGSLRGLIDISSAQITLNPDRFVYSGNWNTPSETVVVNGRTLVINKDYTRSYVNGREAGQGYIEITGIGNYTGTAVKYYTIAKADQTITASVSPASINIGETAQITASGKTALSYSSNNTSIAKVDSSGKVTGVSAGTAVITISTTGSSNYNAASKTVTVTVKAPSAKDLSTASVTLSPTSYQYDGSAKTPSVTVKYGTATLVKDTDYTVAYSNNINAGTAKVTVTGKGSYTGTASASFTIERGYPNLKTSWTTATMITGTARNIGATADTALSYTSSNTSVATVSSTGIVTAKAPGTAVITVKAAFDDNHYGVNMDLTVTVTDAAPYEMNDCTVTLSGTSYTYTGSAISPSVTVKHGSEVLKLNTDYTVSYSNNTNAGTASVTVTGMNGYAGTKTVNFTINKANQTVNITSGTSLTLVKADTSQITASARGTLSYSSSNTNVATVSSTGKITAVAAGTAAITVKAAATSNYNAATATISVTVQNPKNLSTYGQMTLKSTSVTYNGAAQKPGVTVTYSGTTLKEGTDYTVSYSNNVNAGTATATVTGTGGYTGTLSKNFTINKASVNITAQLEKSSIKVGETTKISYLSYTGNGKVSYTSSNTSVLTVDTVNTATVFTGRAAGTAQITVSVEETANYKAASVNVPVTVAYETLDDCTASLSAASYTYDGSAKKPSVTVKNPSGTALVLNTDYTVSYTDNINAGTGTVTVTGTGKYAGTKTLTFTINKATQTVSASVSPSQISVNGTAQITASAKTQITYTSGNTSVASVDSNGKVTGKSAGTVTITVQAAETQNYKGTSKTVTVTVVKNAEAPVISTQPVRPKTFIGDESAYITVGVQGNIRSYQWQEKKYGSSVWKNAEGYSTYSDYYFEVTEDNYRSSFRCVVTSTDGLSTESNAVTPYIMSGKWEQYYSRWYYRFENGLYPSSTWVKIDGDWYFFLNDGSMISDTWFIVNDTYTYYMTSSGARAAGWTKINGTWYYFNTDGTMAANQWVGNYYMKSNGAMATGWLKISGKWYYFGSSGEKAVDWKSIDGDWYYFYSDGHMASAEWVGDYYLRADGDMAYSTWIQVDGNWYYLQSSGAKKKGWLQSGSTWYYMDTRGVMAIGLRTISGTTYYFKSSGAMAAGWVSINGSWYYFESSGAMAKSKWVGDYYLQADGVMATNTWIGKYHVNADGKWDATK